MYIYKAGLKGSATIRALGTMFQIVLAIGKHPSIPANTSKPEYSLHREFPCPRLDFQVPEFLSH